MTWHEANLSLSLASELRVGARQNIAAELVKAQEDQAVASMAKVAGE
jgi:hypothetical protein